MNKILILTMKEVKTFFDSLIGYIILVLFLGITGGFTWFFNLNIFEINQATMLPMFRVSYITLFFLIPALTMRSFSEEMKTGTLELLLTKSITDWQVVIGKFLAVVILTSIALLLTLPYYFSIRYLGDIDSGVVLGGYLGLILMSAAYTAIGIWISSIVDNQIVALLGALIVGVFIHLIFGWISDITSGMVSQVFSYIGMGSHFNSMIIGVFDTKDIIYFLSITFIGLVLTEGELSKRHLS